MAERKRILVTGALGHIGSALIRQLPEGSNIILLDNLESQRFCSLFNLPADRTYRFIEADVRTVDLDSALAGIDVVVHLAAITNAEASASRQAEVESVNLNGLKRVADACLKHRVKIIFPSTTSVYGSQAERVDETCTELKPQSPYAETKLAAERYLQTLGEHGLDFVTYRFGTIFGPSAGMRFHTAVNKFIWQAVLGKPLTVWQTAWQQKRPYLDLRDCLAAINFTIDRDGFDRQTYNVVTGNYTVEQIVATIKQFIPDLTVEFVDSPIMNQLSYDVDAAKLAARGFQVQGDLVQGVEASIKMFSNLNLP